MKRIVKNIHVISSVLNVLEILFIIIIFQKISPFVLKKVVKLNNCRFNFLSTFQHGVKIESCCTNYIEET